MEPIGYIKETVARKAIKKTGLKRAPHQVPPGNRSYPRAVQLVGEGDYFDNGDWEIRPIPEILSPEILKQMGLQ